MRWIEFIVYYAKKHNMKLAEVLDDPNAKEEFVKQKSK